MLHQVQGRKRNKRIRPGKIAISEPENIQMLSKKEHVRLLRAEGIAPKGISIKTGIPLSTVYGFIRKKKKTGPKPKKERNKEIIRRILSGESQAELAREFDISRQRVNQLYKRAKALRTLQEACSAAPRPISLQSPRPSPPHFSAQP